MEIISFIIPIRQSEIFQSTSIPPMGQFSRTFKALNTQIRTSPSQNLPLILSILEDLIIAQETVSRITIIPKDSIEMLKREINGLEREAKGVGAVGVGDVVEDVKRRGQAVLSLPSDGGIIDLTTDVTPPPPPQSYGKYLRILDNDKTFKFNGLFKTFNTIINVITLRVLESSQFLTNFITPSKPRHRLPSDPSTLDNGCHRHLNIFSRI